jgi:hypothetical protein
MNVLEPAAFNAESQYFSPLLYKKFHGFADNNQEGGGSIKQGVQLRPNRS